LGSWQNVAYQTCLMIWRKWMMLFWCWYVDCLWC